MNLSWALLVIPPSPKRSFSAAHAGEVYTTHTEDAYSVFGNATCTGRVGTGKVVMEPLGVALDSWLTCVEVDRSDMLLPMSRATSGFPEKSRQSTFRNFFS